MQPEIINTISRNPLLPAPSSQVILIGPGRVGSALLRQLENLDNKTQDVTQGKIAVIAVVRRSGLVHNFSGIANEKGVYPSGNIPGSCLIPGHSSPCKLQNFRGVDEKPSPGDFIDLFEKQDTAARIIVDATGDRMLPDYYPLWLKQGIHVISANKHAGAGPGRRYREIVHAAQGSGNAWLYETTVGAGLPVISTIQKMLAAGDRIHRIRGCLSGSLSWILKEYQPGRRFSDVLSQARELGFTEPNPLDDISGQDVLRKAVILARELGLGTEPESIECRPLVSLPADSSFPPGAALADEIDRQMDGKLAAIRSQGKHGVYLADISREHGIRVGLEAHAPRSPFVAALPCDNVIEISSDYYRENPLVIQGPGAGPEVTANGILSDVLQIHWQMKPLYPLAGLME